MENGQSGAHGRRRQPVIVLLRRNLITACACTDTHRIFRVQRMRFTGVSNRRVATAGLAVPRYSAKKGRFYTFPQRQLFV